MNVAHSIVSEATTIPLAEAVAALRADLLQLHEQPTAHSITRLEIAVEPHDLLTWLQAQPHATKLFWSERHADSAVAAVGVVDLLVSHKTKFNLHSVIHTLQSRLATAAAGVRYYGGVRFQQRPDPETTWQRFGAYRFVLPQFELFRHNDTTRLAWNLVQPVDLDQALAELDQLALPSPPADNQSTRLLARHDMPDRDGWRRNIEAALDLFDQKTLGKIVLARKAIFDCAAPLDPITLLGRLQAVTPNSFHFCFQPEAGLAFIGATPERLYGRTGRTLKSEAIAGTRPNGPTAEETRRLGNELLHSEKDVREHIFVREHIKANLAPLCETLDVAPVPSLLKLTRRQHLFTPLHGTLQPGITDADILSRLHPTPAVGGEPTSDALDYIAQLEPFDRGWYAGPLGWISANSAEFAVAIRSGLLDGNRLALYSGAGIVAGSTPDSEWNEIENKISDFVGILEHPV